ncbi:hypothetical protein M3627_09810 [Psychrobacillus sp. MER TA 171]|nr:hypothetical protein [Psychrobacillus sp. MER TA 171]
MSKNKREVIKKVDYESLNQKVELISAPPDAFLVVSIKPSLGMKARGCDVLFVSLIPAFVTVWCSNQ